MGQRRHPNDTGAAQQHDARQPPEQTNVLLGLPKPTPGYRRRAWAEFQRALDPLAPIKPLRDPSDARH